MSWSSDFTSVLSGGGQYNAIEDAGMRVDVNTAVGPGNWQTDDYENITNYNEDYSGRHQGGFFLQEQLGWKKPGLRYGRRSGQTATATSVTNCTHDYFFLIYPKLQATYTLSDHALWPEFWETSRLRFAFGESGEPPPPGESLVTWRTVSGRREPRWSTRSTMVGTRKSGRRSRRSGRSAWTVPSCLGRVNYTATAYWRKTYDGLVSVWPPSSKGLEEQYLRNVGNWSAKGIETALDFLVYDGWTSRST